MELSIICRIQDLIYQYSQEGIALWIDMYEGFWQYSVRVNHLDDDNDISWCGSINVPFEVIKEMTDNDIVKSIRHFVEEAKTQVKEEKVNGIKYKAQRA